MDHLWLRFTRTDAQIELRQCLDEGKVLGDLRSEFDRVQAIESDSNTIHGEVARLLDVSADLPTRSDYAYVEPSPLEEIHAECGSPPQRDWDDRIEDRIHGAWMGRCCGCLLGKPVEGWRRAQIHDFLQKTGQYPLQEYIHSGGGVAHPDPIAAGNLPFIDRVIGMPEDDDLNYTVCGLSIYEKHGNNFRPEDVADHWMSNLPILHTCTAERVAYRSFVNNIGPPESALRGNPYREWIGAQIRADFWGYVAPGDPRRAADFAWRDASISHVKNGIYGEMWAAAMISWALVCDDAREAIEVGMACIPKRSRLFEALDRQLRNRDSLPDVSAAVEELHARLDERDPHDWCHTISNAEIVALALLWGGGDFGRTLCIAVDAGFDTDCNGATSGSTMGAILGADGIPESWTEPLSDTLETGMAGFHRVSIRELANRTVSLIKREGRE